MRVDEFASQLEEEIAQARRTIAPPPMLESDILAEIERAAPRARAGRLSELALAASLLFIIGAAAGGAVLLRMHRQVVTPAASASPRINPSALVPDADSGSALGFYSPGGYPLLINHQTTGIHTSMAQPKTWQWSGRSWIDVTPGSTPSAGSNLVYDPQLGMTVVVSGGGPTIGRLLGWNGSAWVDVASTPVSMEQAYLAFDQRRGVLVLFDSGERAGTTWTFDGRTWTQVSSTGPMGHLDAAMAYDPRKGTIVLVGGFGGSGGQQPNDTWIWDGSVWSRANPTAPPAGGIGTMAYDPQTLQMILLEASGTYNWDGSNWSRLTTAGEPPFGGYAGLVYDSSRQELVLWEGNGGYEVGSQTWVYRSGRWSRLQ